MNAFINKSIFRFKYINRFEYFKHFEHVFHLQFTINIFQIYFLISVNEVIFFTKTYKIFETHTSLFTLGARFFVYLIDVLGARSRACT